MSTLFAKRLSASAYTYLLIHIKKATIQNPNWCLLYGCNNLDREDLSHRGAKLHIRPETLATIGGTNNKSHIIFLEYAI